MTNGNKVLLTKRVKKDLQFLPEPILRKFQGWVLSVELMGIDFVRRIPGFHDEPLKGKRSGQRSVRLSRSYRAFYKEISEDNLLMINVIEVNKHEY